MLLSKSRYTAQQYKSLGYPVTESNAVPCPCTKQNREEIDDYVLGQFKNVIKVLFSSSDGRLDSNPTSLVGENAPESVRLFAQNVLLSNIPVMKMAPDDETAFDMLIPRSVQSRSELEPYVAKLREYVAEAMPKSDSPSNPPE
ncbi:hypothetical protein [Sigmofec virus UA08Rod_4104]|uniref:Uncharacterized protein n=1 Tax=Sigmofec virus UA08Rod_4104 TaxID=2929394 RepID=A0A976N145_9VIRU|nr:hypothetical protein [Sigmofec virus UA08Rod_4104]